jgi:HK97 family phage major capsid protein
VTRYALRDAGERDERRDNLIQRICGPSPTDGARLLKGFCMSTPQEQFLAIINEQNAGFARLHQRMDDIEKKANRPGFEASHEATSLSAGAGVGALGFEYAVRSATLPEWKQAIEALIRGRGDTKASQMVAGIDPDGGFLNAPPMVGVLMELIRKRNAIRRLATSVPVSSAVLDIPVHLTPGEVQWVSETAERPNTQSPGLGAIRIEVHEAYTNVRLSQKMIDDAVIDIVQFVLSNSAEDFATAEELAFISGTGVGQPRGFLTYPVAATADATRPWGTMEYIPTGVSGAWPASASDTHDLLVKVKHRLKPQFLADAVWTMPTECVEHLSKLKDTTGRPLWVPSMVAGTPDLLLGHPVAVVDQMPAVAANSLSVAFGNFRRGYTIADRFGLRLLRDPYSAKPFTSLHCSIRVGAGVTDTSAIKAVRFSVS